MSAHLERLRTVLSNELEAGAADALIAGGLDELLRVQAHDEQPGSPLLRMVAALPPRGYRSLDEDQRRTWLRRAIATIRRETALERDLRRVGKRSAESNGNGVGSVSGGTTRTANRGAPQPEVKGGRTAGAVTSTAAPASRARKAPVARASKRSTSLPASPTSVGTHELGLALPIAAAGTRLGKANLTRMEKLGILTVSDALQHFPARHNDFSQTVPISRLQIDMEQTVRGVVDQAREVRMGRGGRMRSTEATVSDESGASIRVTWFNQPFIAKSLSAGMPIALAGKVTVFRGRPTFQNPEFERLVLSADGTHTGRLVPVYPLTQGLPQRSLRGVIANLLERYGDQIEDPLPAEIRKRHNILPLTEAIRQIHYPDSRAELEEARHRIAFDELLAIQVGVQTRKQQWQMGGDAPVVTDHRLADGFLETLPFELTGAQRRVLSEVRSDMARSVPMARLLEGDVGSGKTVVALAAMLDLIDEGYQTVLMAPTEVLAEQHFRTLCKLLSGEPEPPLNGLVQIGTQQTKLVLLTSSTKAKQRREALDAIRHGGAQIIVGTHSLIQDSVVYQQLGLAVVDEQHRFGVLQRGELRKRGVTALGKSHTPHLLVMSATPIPRSLALTVFGDLDLTVIDEMPAGRTPIETKWLAPHQRVDAFGHVRREIEAGRQVFVICPLVEDSEAIQSRAATEEYERLRTQEFPERADRIALLHGRMASRDKDAAMRAFADGEMDILVSTAVVEVGIDIPNATVMVIEGADRFGLAQLHQFRGRVGRGEHASFCYLLSDDPSEDAQERLSVMERTTDGFALAQADLELRGPGDLYGTVQSGLPTLRVASLLDAPLIDATRREAELLLKNDPKLVKIEHQALRYAIARRSANLVAEQH
jgi:ATP-dependent DNA helicase RecG